MAVDYPPFTPKPKRNSLRNKIYRERKERNFLKKKREKNNYPFITVLIGMIIVAAR